MSRATAAAPRSNASEAAAGRQPTRQSRPTPDCRAATSKPLSPPLHDNQTATIMPVPRHQIPILIVARFLSRLPRYSYCCLVLKRHAVELHDLRDEEAVSLMQDI